MSRSTLQKARRFSGWAQTMKYLSKLRWETRIPLFSNRQAEKTINIILEILLWLEYRHT
nr:MAG TPA: hypothetical protein [Caudoviricetes sp.]